MRRSARRRVRYKSKTQLGAKNHTIMTSRSEIECWSIHHPCHPKVKKKSGRRNGHTCCRLQFVALLPSQNDKTQETSDKMKRQAHRGRHQLFPSTRHLPIFQVNKSQPKRSAKKRQPRTKNIGQSTTPSRANREGCHHTWAKTTHNPRIKRDCLLKPPIACCSVAKLPKDVQSGNLAYFVFLPQF